jgi:integral membrane sensor domain MASE1
MAMRNAVIAFACLLAGLLCDALATVPGTAPLLWLPAGVGLAAMLVWGNRAWPGILVSAVLLEFLSLRDAPVSLPLALSCAVFAGLAVACQAMLAATLVRAREHQPLRLDSATEVLRFGLLWSPVALAAGTMTLSREG